MILNFCKLFFNPLLMFDQLLIELFKDNFDGSLHLRNQLHFNFIDRLIVRAQSEFNFLLKFICLLSDNAIELSLGVIDGLVIEVSRLD